MRVSESDIFCIIILFIYICVDDRFGHLEWTPDDDDMHMRVAKKNRYLCSYRIIKGNGKFGDAGVQMNNDIRFLWYKRPMAH